MKTVYITMFAGGLALLTGCQSTESKTEQAPEPRVEQNKLVLPAGSAQLSTLAIESVQPQAATTLRFNGRLIWDDNVTVRIYSPFAGRVSRRRLGVRFPVRNADERVEQVPDEALRVRFLEPLSEPLRVLGVARVVRRPALLEHRRLDVDRRLRP